MSFLKQDVWSLTGAGGLGGMVKAVNVALVEGPIAGANAILEIISRLAGEFNTILLQWKEANPDSEFDTQDVARLLQAMQDRWLGMIAQQQELAAAVEIKTSRSQAERFAASIGLGYDKALTGNLTADYERTTSTGAEVVASYSYKAQSMAPDGSTWSAVTAVLNDAPFDLGLLLKQKVDEVVSDLLNSQDDTDE